jgi:phosphoribosyl 1,2-cyclic phosphodiesterase
MRVCVLGSGSSGNSIYIACGGFGFIIDVGLGPRKLRERLASAGSSLDEVRAVVISHEHHDHISGLAGLCKRHDIPVYANRHTASALIEKGLSIRTLRFFTTGTDFALGPLMVQPFAIPHDARDPVGFIVSSGECRVGIATDLGSPSGTVKRMLRGCRAIVIESNHDEELLGLVPRPVLLKERIRGDLGHLSNAMAAELIAEVASEALSDVFLAHLSRECNRPEFALERAERAVRESGFGNVVVRLTFADRTSDVVEYWPAKGGHAGSSSGASPEK